MNYNEKAVFLHIYVIYKYMHYTHTIAFLVWGMLITAKRRYCLKCTENTAREYKPLLPNSQMISSYCTVELIWPRKHAVVRCPEQGKLAPFGLSLSEHEYHLLFATCLSMFWTGASLPLQLVLMLRGCGWCGYPLLI